MIRHCRHGFAVLATVIIGMSGSFPAHACSAVVSVTDLRHDVTLLERPATRFTLIWRHSVNLTEVEADYVIGPDGGLHQVEERFKAHGPGMEYGGDGWTFENGQMRLRLERPVPRLILRTAPEHRNRLVVNGETLDLTRWPGKPLEIEMRACKERQE